MPIKLQLPSHLPHSFHLEFERIDTNVDSVVLVELEPIVLPSKCEQPMGNTSRRAQTTRASIVSSFAVTTTTTTEVA